MRRTHAPRAVSMHANIGSSRRWWPLSWEWWCPYRGSGFPRPNLQANRNMHMFYDRMPITTHSMTARHHCRPTTTRICSVTARRSGHVLW